LPFYDIRPENGAGLFLQPWSPHGADKQSIRHRERERERERERDRERERERERDRQTDTSMARHLTATLSRNSQYLHIIWYHVW